MTEEGIFRIKPVGNKDFVVENKRKTISPFNSAKHLKTANIPALCNQCHYRSVKDGGNGLWSRLTLEKLQRAVAEGTLQTPPLIDNLPLDRRANLVS